MFKNYAYIGFSEKYPENTRWNNTSIWINDVHLLFYDRLYIGITCKRIYTIYSGNVNNIIINNLHTSNFFIFNNFINKCIFIGTTVVYCGSYFKFVVVCSILL